MNSDESDISELDPRLVQEIDGAIRRSCARYVHDPDDLADAIQDGWEVFLRKRGQIRAFDKVVSFAAKVARNHALDILTRERTERTAFALLDGGDLAPDVEHAPVLRQRFEDELRSLPLGLPAQRRLVLLLWMYGMRHDDIAHALGKAVGTVKATVFQALAQIAPRARDLYERYAELDEPTPSAMERPMQRLTRADLEHIIREIEAASGPLTEAERSAILEPPQPPPDRQPRSGTKAGRRRRPPRQGTGAE